MSLDLFSGELKHCVAGFSVQNAMREHDGNETYCVQTSKGEMANTCAYGTICLNSHWGGVKWRILAIRGNQCSKANTVTMVSFKTKFQNSTSMVTSPIKLDQNTVQQTAPMSWVWNVRVQLSRPELCECKCFTCGNIQWKKQQHGTRLFKQFFSTRIEHTCENNGGILANCVSWRCWIGDEWPRIPAAKALFRMEPQAGCAADRGLWV